MGHGGSSKGEGNFGCDGFALTETQYYYNHVVDKYVFYQCVKTSPFSPQIVPGLIIPVYRFVAFNFD